jgi:FAD/FMN-containing dehydrogenase
MVTRRGFLAGLGSAALVFGFDPVTRRWISVAEAAPFDHIPDLDGTLVTDPASLAPYATDAGSIIHNTPIAVLHPGSVRDIQKMVRFSRRHCIKVAVRGQGHTTFGQSQVEGGLVIDMATISEIHSISSSKADVDAGATWRQLVEAAVPLGATAPVLTGYINLSIGGTLSVGGVSHTNRRGLQIDRVRQLWVVTGEGELERCSMQRNRTLFEAMLGGLGQCGVIVRAELDMIPAPEKSRTFRLNHIDNALFFEDLNTLIERNEFDGVFMLGAPAGPPGVFVRQINAIKYYDGDVPPDPDFLLRDLNLPPAAAEIVDESYLSQALNVDVIIDFFKAIGLWHGVLHPWFDVWVPEDEVETYVGDTLAGLTPEDIGPTGFLLLFPQKASTLTRPFCRVPKNSEWVYLFDILTAAPAPGPDPVFEAQMLDRNRVLFEQARDFGGTRYPIGSVEFDRDDWRQHYGNKWDDFKRAKRRFDPDNILSPGPGIF